MNAKAVIIYTTRHKKKLTISNLYTTNSKQTTKQALQTNLQKKKSIERRGKFTYLLES